MDEKPFNPVVDPQCFGNVPRILRRCIVRATYANGAKVKLSCAAIYAIRATVELARADPNRPIASRELARRGEMPERFLVQILRSLVSSEILRSYPGVAGGYSISRAPDKITLLDIVESVDTPHEPGMPKVLALPSDLRERLENTLAETWEAARKELNKLTIADLAGGGPGLHEAFTYPSRISTA